MRKLKLPFLTLNSLSVIEFVKPYASEMFSLLLSENNLSFSFYQCYLETFNFNKRAVFE